MTFSLILKKNLRRKRPQEEYVVCAHNFRFSFLTKWRRRRRKRKKVVVPKLSFKFKLGGGGGGPPAAVLSGKTTTRDDDGNDDGNDESNPGSKMKTKKKKREFDEDEDEDEKERMGAKKQRRNDDVYYSDEDEDDAEKKAKQLQAKIEALERQQQQFAARERGPAKAKTPKAAAAVPKTGRGKELRGMMMMGMLPSDGPTTTNMTSPGNISGSVDDSDRLELSRLARARSATPGTKNTKNNMNNNKTQKKGTMKKSGTTNGRRSEREQTPPSTVGETRRIGVSVHIFDDAGDINFPSPPSGRSNWRTIYCSGVMVGSGHQQRNNHPPSSLKPSPFGGGGGGNRPRCSPGSRENRRWERRKAQRVAV